MVRLAQERVLLIGDAQRDVQSALTQAMPGAQITSVATVFDGIAELTHGAFSTVLASVEPIERRPEAALRTLRSLAGESRLVLFGHPTLEVLARKMLEFGCDDYVITPANPDDLQQVLDRPVMRIATAAPADAPPEVVPPSAPAPTAVTESKAPEQIVAPTHPLLSIAVEAVLLDALMRSPHDAPAFAIKTINAQIAPASLVFASPKDPAPTASNSIVYSQPLRAANEHLGSLHLILPEAKEEDSSLGEALAQIAPSFAKLVALQERHNRLQKLAITDELTGLYNARYFRHFLTRIVDRARTMRFPVTLLLFDIDDFKKYNDSYGHAVGDEILKQTAQLMRRCCREHDLVARIGGDEFAVVFWDKEGPRKPLEPGKVIGPSRPPSTPLQIFERFKRLAASADFSGLGTSGRGRLSVSGGLAVFPYDATDVAGLIKAADEYLMFHAKQAGKNSIYLVNGDDAGPTPA
ncbi:MAG TPA: GGDEF domain-containing protein [Tepidisphaeraceae bacterium]|nr:GGDEF domain-containing protein [Tepidisphaeraceae bacterium]